MCFDNVELSGHMRIACIYVCLSNITFNARKWLAGGAPRTQERQIFTQNMKIVLLYSRLF